MNGNKGKPKPWLKGRVSPMRKEAGEGALSILMNRYRQTAKSKNLIFTFSREEFAKLTKQNCHYCGVSPSKEIEGNRSFGSYIYNGIDRVDSNLGYIPQNCVTCCQECNRAKWEMSDSEFVKFVERLARSMKERGLIDV